MNLPFAKHVDAAAVREIYHILTREGHRLFIVGGAVRDWIRGTEPKDLDLVTDASPDKIEELFPQTIAVGKAFGVMIVVQDKKPFELATLRVESNYKDGRHPMELRWGTLEEDVLRRDFTINSLYYEPLKSEVLDQVGGIEDIQNSVIKTVGPAERRFEEDHLRVLRAYRFHAQTGFKFDSELAQTLPLVSSLLERVSRERVREELAKLFKAPFREKCIPELSRNQVVEHLFPSHKFDLKDYSVWRGVPPTDFHELCLWSLESGNAKHFKDFIDSLRLSREERRLVELSFGFWLTMDKIKQLSPADMALKLWEPAFEAGLLQYQSLHKDTGLEAIYQSGRGIREMWGKVPPESWIKAQDLSAMGVMLVGAQLGAELKRLYHIQLLGQYRGRDEFLKAYQDGALK